MTLNFLVEQFAPFSDDDLKTELLRRFRTYTERQTDETALPVSWLIAALSHRLPELTDPRDAGGHPVLLGNVYYWLRWAALTSKKS